MSLKFKKPALSRSASSPCYPRSGSILYLPEHTIATITGVEVKRTDKDGPISQKNPADGPITDVYYIYTERPGEKIWVFRNEDTGWAGPSTSSSTPPTSRPRPSPWSSRSAWPSSPPTAGG